MYGYGYSYPNNPQGSGLMGRYEAGVRSDGGSFAFPIDTGLASRLEGLGLLNASSLVNSCNAGKESVLYNLIPTPVQALDRFAVTRSTVKWVLGQDGVLTSIPANTPAFEYNTDGTYRGLLVEPAGTNLVTYSQAFDDASWGKSQTGTASLPVVTPNDAVAPDGTTTADLIVFNRGAGNAIGDRCRLFKAPTVVNATAYNHSIFLKAATGADVGKQIAFRGSAGGAYGVITLTASWVRYDRTETSVSTTGNFELENRGTITVDNTVSVHVWQAQYELGSVATSIIPTVASTQTRTADSVTLTGASSLIGQNATGGTIYTEVDTRDYAPSFQRIIDLAIDTNNRVTLERGTVSNSWRARIRIAGVDVVGLSPTFSSGIVKMAFAYISGSVAVYANGVLVASSTNAFTLPTLTGIGLGCDVAGTTQLNDRIRSVVLFPTRIPNATLATLTS